MSERIRLVSKEGTARLTVSLVLLGLCEASVGAGFDKRYTVHVGDVDRNGSSEIFVRAPAAIPIMIDDLSIVIPPPVRDFVLRSNGQGSFTIGSVTPEQKAAASQWQPSAWIEPFIRDVNQDGVMDLELTGVDALMPSHFNQIIYAPMTAGNLPTGVTSERLKFTRYHEHVFGWLQNRNYFDLNAPRKITSVEPAQRVWWGSIRDVTNVHLMNLFLSECASANPNSACAVSDRPPPPPCVRSGTQRDEQGNVVGPGTTNICEMPVHVIVYTPGSIQISPDYSVFDEDARETAQIIERLNVGCPFIAQTDADRLEQIVASIYEFQVLAGVPPADKMDHFAHVPFPGDDLFLSTDKTFHHYDLKTRICNVVEPGCSLPLIRDQAFRRYTYPPFLLRENYVQIPGPSRSVYVSPPGKTEYPSWYFLPAGPITQQLVTSMPWAGAVQNITEYSHISYPGTISRYVEQEGNWIQVFTHGIGVNRAMCSLNVRNRAWNMLLASANDTYGPKAFRTLDKQIIKYWRSNYVPYGTASSPTSSGQLNLSSGSSSHQ